MEEHASSGSGPRPGAAGAGGTGSPVSGEPETSVDAFPVAVQLPVQWADMDAYGHVNNTAFFRYFESARVEYLVRCGFAASYERDRIGAILHSADCRFRRALVYPDRVIAATRAVQVEEDRFTLEYRLVSLGQEALAARGSSLVVSLDYATGRKAPIPEAVRRGIETLEAEVGRRPAGL